MKMRESHKPKAWQEILGETLPRITLLIYVLIATSGAFSGGLWASAGIGSGIILYLGTALLERRWPCPSLELLLLALAALTIMALLNLLSINPSASWHIWTNLLTIFLPLCLLTAPEIRGRADHKHLFTSLILAACVGAFALGVELFLNAPVLHIAKGTYAGLTQYNRGLSYLIILAMPILASLRIKPAAAAENLRQKLHKTIPFALFIAVLLFPTSFSESRTSKLALLLALAVAAAAYYTPKITIWCVKISTILLLSWPFVIQKAFTQFHDRLSHIPESWHHRMEIWDYMSYRIMEHPWLGWGLGTSHLLNFQEPHGNLYQFAKEPIHPHNVVTQLWVELGLPGLALGLAFAFLTLRQITRLSTPLVPFALGAWTAALCLSLVAYNFWTDSLFAAFALTAFAFMLLERRIQSSNHISFTFQNISD
jgi:O-antigen ligase